jgi:hypothetical protein
MNVTIFYFQTRSSAFIVVAFAPEWPNSLAPLDLIRITHHSINCSKALNLCSPKLLVLLCKSTMLLSMLLIAVAASIAQAQNLASSEPINVQVAALWDPETVESAAEWAAAHEKGDRLVCRLEANDEAAGRLWSDTRNPPSARSQWGDAALRSELPLWGWFIGEYDQEFHCHFSDDDADGHINKIGKLTSPRQPLVPPRRIQV